MTDNEMKELRFWLDSTDVRFTSKMLPEQNVRTLVDHIDRLEKQVSELREALEKYESGNVKCTSYTCGASDDNGEVARAALARLEQESNT